MAHSWSLLAVACTASTFTSIVGKAAKADMPWQLARGSFSGTMTGWRLWLPLPPLLPLLPLQVSSTVEFTRLWWDKHSKHPSMTQVSLWRPVPPPGYVSLGDCMVTGMYCPPSNALVLRDTDPSELVDGRPPLLARPISCLVVRWLLLAAAGCWSAACAYPAVLSSSWHRVLL